MNADDFLDAGAATEPASDLRQLASMLWQTYVALTAEGFSEQQALMVIGQILVANRPNQ